MVPQYLIENRVNRAVPSTIANRPDPNADSRRQLHATGGSAFKSKADQVFQEVKCPRKQILLHPRLTSTWITKCPRQEFVGHQEKTIIIK